MIGVKRCRFTATPGGDVPQPVQVMIASGNYTRPNLRESEGLLDRKEVSCIYVELDRNEESGIYSEFVTKTQKAIIEFCFHVIIYSQIHPLCPRCFATRQHLDW